MTAKAKRLPKYRADCPNCENLREHLRLAAKEAKFAAKDAGGKVVFKAFYCLGVDGKWKVLCANGGLCRPSYRKAHHCRVVEVCAVGREGK